ncbi:MAG: sorbosone dehydrogenase family protein [Novosphingobium sp.]|nr:sorbosone dehydrogenase family protein [Novosphingobium sp.]
MSTARKLAIFLFIVVIAAGGVFAWWIVRGTPAKHQVSELVGKHPLIVDPQVETIPTMRVAKPIGWGPNEAPQAAPGLTVTRFAEGLDHPRTMLTLPNGDVLVAETNAPPYHIGGITGMVMGWLMKRAGAAEPSPNAIVLLRDADGDGKAEQRFTLRHPALASPSGMAWGNGKLYVANHDAVLAFDFTPGQTGLTGSPTKLMDLPAGGRHWMRNLLLSPDGKLLYVSVGSSSNIAEDGIDKEQGRAGIWEIDLTSGRRRQYAGGMRNPNGMDWNPATGELWTVVNERDQLGPDVPPDYLTNVPIGAQYGWPWVYWKNIIDERVTAPMPDFLTEYTRRPEYALGPHVAALGLVFVRGGEKLGPNFADGAIVAEHGSWNRRPPSGYDVEFVPFDDHGNPLDGPPRRLLTGFLTGRGPTHGRPTWLAWDKGGGLLVSDDTAGIIWRVIAQGAAPAAAIKPVVTAHMPPQRELKGEPTAQFQAKFGPVRQSK